VFAGKSILAFRRKPEEKPEHSEDGTQHSAHESAGRSALRPSTRFLPLSPPRLSR
jgi:hypothetical protein